MEEPLLYQTYDIMFQECPGETSLGIMISGCKHHCKGCHSPNLWKYEGKKLVQDIQQLLDKYSKYITCVIFMGGDQNPKELLYCLKLVEKAGLKTCLYTGCEYNEVPNKIVSNLNYIKTGEYKEKLGGLKENTTNQNFYEIHKLIGIEDDYAVKLKKIKFYNGDYTMNFCEALEKLKEGKKVGRQGWNGKEQYIEVAKNISYKNSNNEIVNAQHEAMGNNAIAFVGTSGVQIGWLASQADLFAEDWVIIEK